MWQVTAAENQKAAAKSTINHQEQSAAGWKMDQPGLLSFAT